MPNDYDLSQFLNSVFLPSASDLAAAVIALTFVILLYVFFREVLRFGEKPREPE